MPNGRGADALALDELLADELDEEADPELEAEVGETACVELEVVTDADELEVAVEADVEDGGLEDEDPDDAVDDDWLEDEDVDVDVGSA